MAYFPTKADDLFVLRLEKSEKLSKLHSKLHLLTSPDFPQAVTDQDN